MEFEILVFMIIAGIFGWAFTLQDLCKKIEQAEDFDGREYTTLRKLIGMRPRE